MFYGVKKDTLRAGLGTGECDDHPCSGGYVLHSYWLFIIFHDVIEFFQMMNSSIIYKEIFSSDELTDGEESEISDDEDEK